MKLPISKRLKLERWNYKTRRILYLISKTNHIKISFSGFPNDDIIAYVKELEMQGYVGCSWLRWYVKVWMDSMICLWVSFLIIIVITIAVFMEKEKEKICQFCSSKIYSNLWFKRDWCCVNCWNKLGLGQHTCFVKADLLIEDIGDEI